MAHSPSARLGRVAFCLVAVAVVLPGCGNPPREHAAAKAAARGVSAAALTGGTACSSLQTCTATDAHAKHQAQGIDCTACHPCGAKYGFRVGYTFPGGTAIQPTDGYTPGTATSPPSCTVACHYVMGSPAHAVTWDAAASAPLPCTSCHDVATLLGRFPAHPAVSPTASRSDCEACHVAGAQHTSGNVVLQGHPDAWMAPTSPGFHALSANNGLAACQSCHLRDLSGGATKVACTQCHKAGGTANDFATCTACHGGTDSATGAPPAAIWGFAGDPDRGGGVADPVRVGAHTAHVVEGQFGPAFDCNVCHVKPTDFTSPNHIDTVAQGANPVATVTFSGLAVNGLPTPTWSRSGATCNGTYCHGSSLSAAPGTVNNPVWTGGAGQVFCGSCHGVPPVSPHVSVDTRNGYGVCSPCHSLTVDPAGRIIPASQGGKHLNGFLEASGHDAAWMDRASPGFHAFAANRGVGNCTPCHGADLLGGSVHVGCTDCHKPGGQGNDFATCTACHGGTNSLTGAPPAAIWGYAGDPLRGGGTKDPVRVGAHDKHVAPVVTKALDCGVCHVKPTSILSAGHIDDPTPVAKVTFGGLAVPVQNPGAAPAWTRDNATCASTYCHGNYAGDYVYEVYNWGSDSYDVNTVHYVGANATPVWTDGPMTCGSCHGNPPSGTGTWHSGFHGYDASYRQCQLCHPDASSTNGIGNAITNTALHINGTVEVTPKWTTKCFGCH